MTSTSVCAAVRDIFHVFAAAFLSNNRFSVFPFQSFLHGLQYSDLCHFLLAAKSLSNTHTHTHTHTNNWVCLDIRDHVPSMYACMYVLSRLCASVHGRVQSLSRHSSILPPRRSVCWILAQQWTPDKRVNRVSVSTVARDSGSYFKRLFIGYCTAVRGDKNHL